MKQTTPPASNSLRYIRRITQGHTTWKVAIRRFNQTHHQYFTDSAYGGKAKALAAAKVWRDQVFKRKTNANYALWRREAIPRRNNTSDVVGLHRAIVRKEYKGRITYWPNWQVYWNDADGKRHTRAFSVNLYGEEQAKELAWQARQQGLAELVRDIKARERAAATKKPRVPKR